jgi:hypothetical protein
MDQQLTVSLRYSLRILIQTKVTKTPDSSLLYVFLTLLQLTMAILKITSDPEFAKFCDFVALELLFSLDLNRTGVCKKYDMLQKLI